MSIVLWALALVIAALIGLACLRVELVATLQYDGKTAAKGEARALFGWIRVPFEGVGPAAEGGSSSARRSFRAPNLADGVRLAELAAELFRRIARRIHLTRLEGDVRFGFEDPADTGVLWGTLGTFAVLAEERHPRFRVRPVFHDSLLMIDTVAAFAFRPLVLFAVILAAVLRPRHIVVLYRVARGPR